MDELKQVEELREKLYRCCKGYSVSVSQAALEYTQQLIMQISVVGNDKNEEFFLYSINEDT